MYLSHLRVKNFKGFGSQKNEMFFGIPDGQTPGSGLNILVGENNSGKSTIFEAIDFLRDGTSVDLDSLKNKLSNQSDVMFVEGEFTGEVISVIDSFSVQNKKNVLVDCVYRSQGSSCECLRIKRTTETKDKVKNLLVYNHKSKIFENKSGIDAPIKKLYENYFIWADMNPSDEAKFGASTLCGRLLKEIIQLNNTSEEYILFKNSFDNYFNNKDSELGKQLNFVQNKMTSIFSSQFGCGELSFHVDELKVDNFFKNLSILVDDGIKVPMGMVGQGMQRSIALALIQVYADVVVNKPEISRPKPFFLFIDEPELSLHPSGQFTLLDALLNLSKTQQIFITCHSPIFLQNPKIRNSHIFFFQKIDGFNEIDTVDDLNLFPWSPSWGEIIYKAYKLPTKEFHNELYGYLDTLIDKTKWKYVDEYLIKEWDVPKNHIRKLVNSDKTWELTLPSYIRHAIHHPDGKGENPFTQEEMSQSIEILINVLKNHKN